MTTTNITINTPLDKESLVEKLLNEGHISFREALLLMDRNQYQPPVQPYIPPPLSQYLGGITFCKD